MFYETNFPMRLNQNGKVFLGQTHTSKLRKNTNYVPKSFITFWTVPIPFPVAGGASQTEDTEEKKRIALKKIRGGDKVNTARYQNKNKN
jgi:hypothetical protein